MQIAGGVAGSAIKGASLGSLFGPIGSAIGGAAGGIAGLWNAWQGTRTANWQKKAQETTWQREDTAQQRAVTDLRAAGLSPTLAAGHGAPTSAPVRPETPQYDPRAALAMMQMKADISKTAAETRVLNANAKVAEATIGTKIGSQAQALKLMDLQEQLQNNQINKSQYDAAIRQIEHGYYAQGGWSSRQVSLNKQAELREQMMSTEKRLQDKYADPAQALGITGSAATQLGAILEMILKISGKNRVYR